jgi:ABC-type proline/glycine betaine transport system permease subunit
LKRRAHAFLIAFLPMTVKVLSAVCTVDPDLVGLARAFKATRAQIFRKIEFPSSLPPMFVGLRIGSTLAVVGIGDAAEASGMRRIRTRGSHSLLSSLRVGLAANIVLPGIRTPKTQPRRVKLVTKRGR